MAPSGDRLIGQRPALITVQAARVSAQWPICGADWREPGATAR